MRHSRNRSNGAASLDRRRFLGRAASLAAASATLARQGGADDFPAVSDPRATDGDLRFEPNWTEQLTVRVGCSEGDLVGRSDRPIQAAIDYVAGLGGGTVELSAGVYTLRRALFLRPRVRLTGRGADTVITKIASSTVGLAADSDWYDQEITLKDDGGFQVGDDVVLRATNPHDGGQETLKRTLVARSGNRFKLDKGLRTNLWLAGNPTCASLFPLLTSERTADVVIEDLALDGNREQNDLLDGNYAGCIFLQDCNRFTIRRVTARNYHGDGISFQICHDVRVEECHCHDNADLGIHPGSGSQRPRILQNRLERNGIGVFWCWGVKFGLAENNAIHDNRDYGISIGHCDTDNVMRNNDIRGSGKAGILFRDDSRGADFWPHRNLIERNRILDSGGPDGIGIDIQGKSRDLRILHNEIRETREPAERIGIRIGADVGHVELHANRLAGFAHEVVDHRAG
jgi:parallel beta-helix repeat protein